VAILGYVNFKPDLELAPTANSLGQKLPARKVNIVRHRIPSFNGVFQQWAKPRKYKNIFRHIF
jgi:hypothetical protein